MVWLTIVHHLSHRSLPRIDDKLVHNHQRSKELPKGPKAQEPAQAAQRLDLHIPLRYISLFRFTKRLHATYCGTTAQVPSRRRFLV